MFLKCVQFFFVCLFRCSHLRQLALLGTQSVRLARNLLLGCLYLDVSLSSFQLGGLPSFWFSLRLKLGRSFYWFRRFVSYCPGPLLTRRSTSSTNRRLFTSAHLFLFLPGCL